MHQPSVCVAEKVEDESHSYTRYHMKHSTEVRKHPQLLAPFAMTSLRLISPPRLSLSL